MGLRLASQSPSLGAEVHFSYYVKRKDGKPSRVGFARVLDISETGLCMEMSPLDSDLFAESFGDRPVLNREIELQIFCRSHPSNVFVEGSVRWFKQKRELDLSSCSSSDLGICAGVVFSIDDAEHKKDIVELIRRFRRETVLCRICGARVSADGAFCYDCGTRLVRRRSLIKNALFDVLVPDSDPPAGV